MIDMQDWARAMARKLTAIQNEIDYELARPYLTPNEPRGPISGERMQNIIDASVKVKTAVLLMSAASLWSPGDEAIDGEGWAECAFDKPRNDPIETDPLTLHLRAQGNASPAFSPLNWPVSLNSSSMDCGVQ